MKAGRVKTLLCHGEGPLNWENQEIEFSMLNLLCGANNTGKSIILKLVWVMNMITQAIVQSNVLKQPVNLEQSAQFILDNSIPDHESFSLFGLKYISGAQVSMIVYDGIVQKIEHSGLEKVNEPERPVFMSTTMRLFSAIKLYLSIRKFLGTDDPLKRMEGLVKSFKLYDIMYIEGLIAKMPVTFNKIQAGTLKSMEMGKDLQSIEFIGDDFVGVYPDEKRSLALLGNGEQAMINMMLGNLL